MSLAPAENAPVGSGIERRPAIMSYAWCGEDSASVMCSRLPCRSFSPMPDLVVRVAQFGDLVATYRLDARNHIAGIESPLRGVLGDVMDLHTLVDQIGRVAGQPRRLHLLPPTK